MQKLESPSCVLACVAGHAWWKCYVALAAAEWLRASHLQPVTNHMQLCVCLHMLLVVQVAALRFTSRCHFACDHPAAPQLLIYSSASQHNAYQQQLHAVCCQSKFVHAHQAAHWLSSVGNGSPRLNFKSTCSQGALASALGQCMWSFDDAV